MNATLPANERLFTLNFVLIWVSTFFAFTSFHLLLPILPPYVLNVGGTNAEVGLITGILAVTSVAARPWIGHESDRRGKKLVLVLGTLALVASSFSYMLASTLFLLIIFRLFHGVGWAATTTASPALVADLSPVKRRGETMGWYGTASSVAMALAPLLAVAVNAAYGFTPTFLVAAATALVALGAAAWVKEPGRSPAAASPRDRTGSPWDSIVYRPAVVPSVAMFVVALTYGSLITFVSLLAYANHLNPGTFFTVFAAFLIIARPLGGKIADMAGRTAAIIPGMVAMVIALALLAFASDLPHLLLTAALYGIGFAFVNPPLMAMTADRAAPEQRGAAMGTFSAAYDLGMGIGAIALGFLLEKTSFQVLYLTTAGIAVAGMLVYVLAVRRR
ncbi:MAG: MFS transporter [Dehalococcoidia bacterium]|nr:MFS transporter [Dehalococcoidia bacterium]